MSKFKIVKTILVAGSVCAALWQAAKFMEILSEAKGQQASRNPTSMLSGLNLPGMPGGTGGKVPDPAELLKQIQGSGAGAGKPEASKEKELVIFSADGKKRTAEQLEALKREAERNRPKVPSTTPPRTQP